MKGELLIAVGFLHGLNNQLEEPLIGLGFADGRQDVLDMIEDVDEDGSGQIEFEEFLLIIKNSDTNEKTA